MIECLKQQPYNLAFGLYAIKTEHYVLQHMFYHQLPKESLDEMFKACSKFQQFCLYRLFGSTIDSFQQKTIDSFLGQRTTIAGEMVDAEYAGIKGALEFVKSITKHGNNLHKFGDHIGTVHNAVRTGKVGQLKGVVDKHIPKEGLFLITGLETKDYKI